ncbi:recombinase family protein [Gelidibacter mesophilus]|uniref:recombinase family protein n=1 Tax=Gelidibacter mesophilus TaxID=169050 RepID=UPI0004138C55|nr:recombinase family protein [Gelidibacter mesophilus]
MVFGYARVSTTEQNIESQKTELLALGCEKLFLDKASGKDLERVELNKLMEVLRPKDVLIVLKLDRLARSLKDLIFLLDEFARLKIVLKIGELNFDFSTAEGRFIANVFGAVAEFERELIRARTIAGLNYARSQGRIGGKPKGLSDTAKLLAKEAYNLRLKGLTADQLLKATGIKSKRTLYKYIRFEAKRISEKEGIPLNDNGLELLKVE